MTPKTIRARRFPIGNEFTLVELLVVISIVSILAAMLLPVLQKARKSALEINCLNQMKQINVAAMLYAERNEDRFPSTNGADDSYYSYWSWDDRLSEYDGRALPDQRKSFDCLEKEIDPNGTLYVCPADTRMPKMSNSERPNTWLRSYVPTMGFGNRVPPVPDNDNGGSYYTCGIAASYDKTGEWHMWTQKISRISNTSGVAMFFEFKPENNGLLGSLPNNSVAAASLANYFNSPESAEYGLYQWGHGQVGMMNWMFVDGHGEFAHVQDSLGARKGEMQFADITATRANNLIGSWWCAW